MAVAIASRIFDAIVAHVASDPAREVCGLLLGTSDRIAAAIRSPNVATDPSVAFEVDPVVLFRALRHARNDGPAIIGNYHSHPRGQASPSVTDAAMIGAVGDLWLIAGGGQLRCWRAISVSAFAPAALTIDVRPG